jgi:hypothetical protein
MEGPLRKIDQNGFNSTAGTSAESRNRWTYLPKYRVGDALDRLRVRHLLQFSSKEIMFACH